MKLLTSTVKDESKSCMPERCFCEGPIKCINWTSTTDFQLNQNVSSWSPWREWLSDSQQVDVSGKIGFLSNSTFDVRHHYLSKSSEFGQTSHCLTAHSNIINSVQPLNNLIISTSSISLTLASSQWNVYLTFECFETSGPIYLWKVGYIWLRLWRPTFIRLFKLHSSILNANISRLHILHLFCTDFLV